MLASAGIISFAWFEAQHQPVKHDWRRPSAPWTAEWFVAPVETSAFRRLGLVDFGGIDAVFPHHVLHRLVTVGNVGIIYTSNDGGATWTKAGSGTTNEFRAVTLSLDSARAIAVG